MLTSSIGYAILVVLFGIVPSVSTERPRTKQQSRGTPVWADLSRLALKGGPRAASAVQSPTYQRLAVVANSNHEDTAIVAAALSGAAAYCPNIVAIDPLTTQDLFGTCPSAQDAREIAKQNKLDWIVWCDYQADTKLFSITPFSISDKNIAADSKPLTLASEGNWLESIPALRISLFQSLGKIPADRTAMIARVPSKNLEAYRSLILAEKSLRLVLSTSDVAERKKLGARAFELATQAIKLDSNFIEAYLVKASCLDEQGQDDALQQTLRDAYARKNPAQHDEIVLLELEGDYAHFCSGNLETAIESYQKILAIEPSNLRALWSLVDIYLAGDGISKPLPEDISEASTFAARILEYHPESAIAKALMTK